MHRVLRTFKLIYRLVARLRLAQNVSSQCGSAVTEFTIVLPFLALMVTATIDIGNILNEYLRLTEAVHQGARMASEASEFKTQMQFAGLTAGQQGCGSETTAMIPTPPSDVDKHRLVQQRVENIVTLQSTSLNSTSLCIRSELELGSTPLGSPQQNVRVRLTARYDSFFPLFNNLPISVEATAPFLQG